MKKENIRNFSIIAHIDHGKSTLSDRILEYTGSISKKEMKSQILDNMDLERELGITIKLNAVQISYKYNNEEYILNLIDTSGHFDFTYEVFRSLAASDGVLLLIDATQGVQPKTIANMYLALENNLVILPVINKIDSELANIKKSEKEIKEILGLEINDIVYISAKTGKNIDQVLKLIIEKIPAPQDADDKKPLKALVFDSYFDSFRGIIVFIRLLQGRIKKGDKLKFLQNKHQFEVISVGVNTPFEKEKDHLEAGETGWIVTNEKDIHSFHVGDTLTYENENNITPIQGYKSSKPMVFSGFYPIDTNKYLLLEEALGKISLSDSSLTYEKESSKALGFGFRIGFLGLLHLEIIQERIEREFKIDIISTAPSVIYNVYLKDKKEPLIIRNPSDFPDKVNINYVKEPYVKLSLFSPQVYVGKLMEYIHRKRGNYIDLEIFSEKMNALIYEIPLAEIVFGFFDSIKSISKGYASFDYQ
ncbi:MAG: elongation factor 4 [Candidatus Hepatoplasma vulgare]|nr:MAG: elongation factor 4 [Candidatus Hepatoplasma sp.]